MSMIGHVDAAARALIEISVVVDLQSIGMQIEVWIDTGCTGELVLPLSMISSLGLVQSGTISAELGDGSEVELKTFTCFVEWFGVRRQIEVIGNTDRSLLLGVGLLRDRKLAIDFPSRVVSIE